MRGKVCNAPGSVILLEVKKAEMSALGTISDFTIPILIIQNISCEYQL